MSDIEIRDLSVKFPDGTEGLKDITLDISSGEFVALVGPSGSGKTTLLRTIAGFIAPSSGEILIDGKDQSATPPAQRNMGMVFQQHAVWPHMSVADNVAYPLRRSGAAGSEITSKVEQTLETVGLGGYGKRKPATLSGGQQQRVALARAIVSTPKVLLLDEALSALDEPLRDSLRRELVSLTKGSDLTSVHVTHDRKEALAIADRIAVLRDGKLEQFGTPMSIVSRPATAWVASFIADATLLEGVVAGGRVTVDKPALSWSVDNVTVVSEDGDASENQRLLQDGQQVTVAVLPEAVSIDSSSSGTEVTATVTSALFEVSGFSVTVDLDGTEFRAWTSTSSAPEVDDQVQVEIRQPLVYVDSPADA